VGGLGWGGGGGVWGFNFRRKGGHKKLRQPEGNSSEGGNPLIGRSLGGFKHQKRLKWGALLIVPR